MDNRKDILLRAAYDLIKRSTMATYTASAQSTMVHYDEADCDGLCLMEDILTELDLEGDPAPIPLAETSLELHGC